MKRNKHFVEERILLNDLSSYAGEAYQKLQVNVDLANVNHKYKVIGVTSSLKSEGKSTTIVNLANIYAKKGKKVIICDFDLRRPSIHFYFKKPNENGLVDFFMGDISKEELIKHSSEGIDFINRGKSTPFPAEVLESPKLKSLIESLKEKYDYIFIDCPPILVAADTTLISKYLDGMIVVVKTNYATKDMVAETFRALKDSKISVIGCVMTDVPTKHGRYYGYYEGYSE